MSTGGLADQESLWIVGASEEQDAYATGLLTEDDMGAGIIMSYMAKSDIQTENLGGKEALAKASSSSDGAIASIAVESNDNTNTSERRPAWPGANVSEEMYELYADESIMDTMLKKTVDPQGDDALPWTLDELTIQSYESDEHDVTSPVPEVEMVYSKYNCRTVAYGGPIAVLEYAEAYIAETKVDDSFYIMDLGNVTRLYEAWHKAMPRITPFYAVKCSPLPALIDLLASKGCGFDCASAAEIQLVLDANVGKDRIIFAHPSKRPNDIRFAANHEVSLTTFDSVVELQKIAKWYPGARCVLRIRADDPKAGISFGIKHVSFFSLL